MGFIDDNEYKPAGGSLAAVTDWNPDDRPRERALQHGCRVLSTSDLWALILRTGLPGLPITEICKSLMRNANGKLKHLERMERDEIMATPGIGEAKVLQIEAVMELVHRYLMEQPEERPRVTCSNSINAIIGAEIGNLDHEEIWVLFMQRNNTLIRKERFSSGSAVASIFDIKAILRRAILCKAEAIALCHNHPSGNLQPSPQDDNITHKLYESAKMMDITLIDHLTVTAGKFYSYHDNGRLR